MIGRWVRVLLVAVAAVVPLLGVTGAARADQLIGVSRDGVAWSPSLATPLFDPSVLWVPGDVRSASFYVRNQAGDAGTLWLRVDTQDGDGLLARDDVEISVRRDGGAWTTLPGDARAHAVRRAVLRAGSSTRIDVRAVFVPSSPNRSQESSVALRFTVGLRESASVSDPSTGGGGGPGGLLPNAGGVELWVLVLGLALVVTGALVLLLVSAQRTEDEEARDG